MHTAPPTRTRSVPPTPIRMDPVTTIPTAFPTVAVVTAPATAWPGVT